MSTLAYAAMTGKREQAQPNRSTSTDSPGLQTYVDALAALVPAEVLTAHGAILTFTTKTAGTSVDITEPNTLFYVFWALIALSMVLYVAGRLATAKLDPWDSARVLIPPLSFVGWTMLQKATAFDGVLIHLQHLSPPWAPLSDATRSAVPIIGAILLGVVASALAYKADQKTP